MALGTRTARLCPGSCAQSVPLAAELARWAGTWLVETGAGLMFSEEQLSGGEKNVVFWWNLPALMFM